MNSIWDRDGEELAEILARLAAGSLPATLGLDASGFASLIANQALGPEGAMGPPLTRSSPPERGLLLAASEEGLAPLLPRASRPDRLALSAGLLQVLDFWEESHEAAQEADDRGESRFSPYWHAIAHRREPDPGNAGYWFRRVGRHPVFADLVEAARPILADRDDPALTDRLLKGGAWDPMAFVAFCGRAERDARDARLARRLQRAEMALLLKATAENAGCVMRLPDGG